MNITTIFYIAFYSLFCLGAVFIAAKWWETRQNDKTNEFNHLGLVALGLVAFASWSMLGDISSSKMQTRKDVVAPYFEKATTTIQRQYLGDYVSEEGESLDAFVLRTAPALAEFTNRTGFEACAYIGQNQAGLYSYSLSSIGAQLSCILDAQGIPEGFSSLGISIHSHPTATKIRPNQVDFLLAQHAKQLLNNEVRNGGAKGFSTADFQGPGYLVAGSNVLHQQGFGTVRRVK
ncbi:hypothetical protein B9Y60_10535 [Stenotrophomonas maltophilia]|uniref:hypothetical protein n=1 Tax=Stenotrophomonas maltophilia TaxID=40324 RepID=UPI000C25D182|nr:hypothetical protein [Stenotrophomonas maltophilia]PJL52193.1 hypothetical protein B9Y73_10535 [Stenotrophomonas maltophilia]PJL55114.1 hypothetical protein B9Y60_10535 [Stenotrophomonas maltophilia]